MKVLSLSQPWASLVAFQEKALETRSWPTRWRGPLAIHASKGKPPGWPSFSTTEPFASVLASHGVTDLEQLPRGQIIAVAELVDCFQFGSAEAEAFFRSLPQLGRCEEHFGNMAEGRWGWVLRNARRLTHPIPVSGSLGLWNFDEGDIRSALEDQEETRP